MATFQVYPPELKDYMTKMNCFCYEEQTLKGGEKEKYALVLLVDPNVTKNIKEAIIQFIFFKNDNKSSNSEILTMCAVCISDTSGGQIALMIIVLSFILLGLLNLSWKKYFKKARKVV